MSRVLASIAVTLAIACASGVRDPSLPQATANIEVVSVAPSLDPYWRKIRCSSRM